MWKQLEGSRCDKRMFSEVKGVSVGIAEPFRKEAMSLITIDRRGN